MCFNIDPNILKTLVNWLDRAQQVLSIDILPMKDELQKYIDTTFESHRQAGVDLQNLTFKWKSKNVELDSSLDVFVDNIVQKLFAEKNPYVEEIPFESTLGNGSSSPIKEP